MHPVGRFFTMLAALLGLFVSLIQVLVLATTPAQVVIASIGCALSVLVGLMATKEDF